ncbi:MAG: ABC transporter ATP-binding protein [Eubacteriales bacterium]|nr:ABC transporter ATP-binding protein [Eubacteriales bacterium]
MAVAIHIHHVKKQYEDNVVIQNLSIDIKPGELFTLLGPSGCGKTTLLRMIAGFNSIEAGTIAFDDQVINEVPIYKRNFGMVFQSYAIFPNMTVYRNVEYGLKNKKLPKKEIQKRVEKILEAVRLTKYKDRYPDKLSGGQQQRVALARAVVVEPQVLLMDEPLSNLDAKLRLEMRSVISCLQHDLGITTVYVTHDQEEALAISSRIAVINAGDIYQIDIPERIYSRPYNTFVATFIGSSSMIPGVVKSADGRNTVISTEIGIDVALDNMVPAQPGREVLVGVRPEEFVIVNPGEGAKGKVRLKQFLGKNIKYEIVFEGGLVCEVSSDTNTALRIYETGEEIWMNVNERRINVFDKTEKTTLIEGVESHV